ncbi:hypothetical protein RJ639_027861 [Escallonia herrerae]|uniref:Uncharacterized protein n=1 Tax=Escallonia herrerae TaxID=1293975 RepID=A0AA88XD78_9ASTE|nr:hypothetical protein RJ639_027861 [Escallonia herrerae]
MGARLDELVRAHGRLLEGRGGAELDGRGGAVLGGCKGQPVTLRHAYPEVKENAACCMHDQVPLSVIFYPFYKPFLPDNRVHEFSGKIYEIGSSGISSLQGHSKRRSKCLNDFFSLSMTYASCVNKCKSSGCTAGMVLTRACVAKQRNEHISKHEFSFTIVVMT